MIIPELPSYLESMGGGEYKGLIIALFTLTAGLSRPISGKLTDRVGRIPVMIFGTTVCFVIGFIYPILTTVWGFLFLRFIHGFSTGFKPTATSAYVADVVPFKRRGEAMGILGISGSLGMAAGPALGSEIAEAFSLQAMFHASSGAALLSILVIIWMKETLEPREPFRLSLLRINRSDVLEPSVIPPALVMLMTAFSFGVMLTLVPDLSDHIGLRNRGTFFTAFTISSIMIRITAGKASDKYGRLSVLRVSTLLLAISMLMIGFAETKFMLLAAGVVFGLAAGMNSPTIFAWTIDMSVENHRGRGMSTMFLALEIGVGAGAFLSGWIYGNDIKNLPNAFVAGAVFSIFAFIYIQFFHNPKEVPV